MKHSLPAENLDIETSAIPHTHGEDEHQEYVAPKWAIIEHKDRRKLCKDGVKKLPAHKCGFPILRCEFRYERSNDASFGIQEEVEGRRPLAGLDFFPPIDKDELPI